MYSPTTRLLTVLEILQARRQVSGAELAARLEVDGRTVRRYITMLQDMGVPVESTRGRHGAYQLRSGFRLPPLLFTDEEVLALTLGLLTVRQNGLAGDPAAVEGALAKIERVLPADLQEQVRALSDRLVFDIPAIEPSPAIDALAILSSAAHQGRRVWLRHAGAEGSTEREVDPYGLVHRSGKTYLTGYCHLRQAIRVFRLDRITDVDLRPEVFDPPEQFDALAHVLQTLTSVPRAWQVEVLLQTTLAEASRRVPAGVATLTETPEGILLQCQTENLDWFARVLIWLHCPLTVIDPPELRTALGRLAQEAAELAATGNTAQQ